MSLRKTAGDDNIRVVRFGALAAWVAMTILFSFAAWQVVQATEQETTDTPSAPLVMASGLSTSSTEGTGLTTTVPEATTSTVNEPTSTSSTTATTSTSTDPTTATSSPATSTSTAPNTSPTQSPNNRVIDTKAGTVSVSYGAGGVHFNSASPTIGWSVELENAGPDEVEVSFESDDLSVDVTVEWEDGELQIEIDEESDD